ncbi:MAG TPA: hypothetical protein DCS93_02430 [Microscillaceae bacterium]|nr:hypothetical protein [Microscillaceae bacterium]
MPQFQTIEQAFEWFLENVYPNLSSEDKHILRNAKYAFYKEDLKISTKRMNRILREYSTFKVMYDVEK